MSTALLYCGWDEIAKSELLIYDEQIQLKRKQAYNNNVGSLPVRYLKRNDATEKKQA